MFNVIEHGGMLIIDEFSSAFHNELEALFVKFFMMQTQKGQIFLVSHSTNLLSNTIFRPE
ncbi:AAA family ATPase [Cellulosilyticum ruminicola]|uniref:AAA family ATPase n=1 Tax=Cellulosilyticum ruminicola TaxID=425254 RepID=UPI0006D0585F|nr:AAA family ATPase [Cellulosilyticum ruminicola]